MMMKVIGFIALLFLTIACAGPAEKEATTSEPTETELVAEEVCTYSYSHITTEVLWVAYKYTEKTGVKGVFDSVWVDGASAADNPQDVLNGVTFKIMTSSVNSGDPTRDPKIVESFFGTLEGSEYITGKVSSVDGNENSGTMTMEITLNGLSAPVEGTYSIEEGVIEFESKITVETWEATGGIAKLNEVCSDLHKGADGESILWPDVSLFISTTLDVECETLASRE